MLVSLTAADFLRYINWAIFLLIGSWTITQAVRRPSRVNIHVGLLFGGLGAAIVINVMVHVGLLTVSPLLISLTGTALFAMPFLLVRLMDDLVGVPQTLMRVFMGAFALYLLIAWLVPLERMAPFLPPLVLGLLATLAYVVVVGLQAVRRTQGITQRRLLAISVGGFFLGLNFGAGQLPTAPEDARSLVDIFGLAAGVSYYLGFSPPRWLRQLWQSLELRAFLIRSASLPQFDDSVGLLRALEQGAAAALGAPHARIGLWDSAAQAIRFPTFAASMALGESSDVPAVRAFQLQLPIFSRDTHYDPALDAQFDLRTIARAVLAAPITVGNQRLGVLCAYGPRVSLFAEDDLALLQLLADQIAVVLESRRLAEQFASVRAREEAARLKEDFLSAAAHDLKTPLTSLLGHAQLAERRALRNPEVPADLAGLRRIVSESERLRTMVLELLDAARAEQDQPADRRESVDLAALVRRVAQRHEEERHAFVIDTPEQLEGRFDPRRIEQLLDNLAENAVKYSPAGGTITVQLWQDASAVHLTVTDQGIGIPADDLPHLFERFHRGANVNDRQFTGWGIGLSICRRIVEQHGGQITVSSREGQGSTFHVTLPAADAAQEPHVTAQPNRC